MKRSALLGWYNGECSERKAGRRESLQKQRSGIATARSSKGSELEVSREPHEGGFS